MKTANALLGMIIIMLLAVASPLQAQYWPGRDREDRNRQPPNRTRPGIERGTPTAPTETAVPENQQPIPPGDEVGEPEADENRGFYSAIEAALQATVYVHSGQNPPVRGFLIKGNTDDTWFVVTGFQPLAGVRGFGVRFSDGSGLKVDGLYAYDEAQDLALIQVQNSKNKKIRPLELGDRNPRPDEVVFAVGDPRQMVGWAAMGKTLKLVTGTDVDAPFGSEWIQTDPIITPANQGGPLMAGNGKVIGLLASPGKMGRGPHLSVPLSKIREMVGRETLGLQANVPSLVGGFKWPQDRARRTETFAFSRAQAAALAVQRNLKCNKCEGHGILVTPIYRVDGQGNRTKTGEQKGPCEICGGAGIIIKPAIHELCSNLTRMILNPDDRWTDEQKISSRKLVEETFDFVAVNRKMLADVLNPISSRILADFDRNRDSAVTFLAQTGPIMNFHGTSYQWVKPMGGSQWIATYGATLRTPSLPQPPEGGGGPQGGRRQQWEAQRRNAMKTNYILVTGIIRGTGVIESDKKVYQAPLLEVSDLIMLRQ